MNKPVSFELAKLLKEKGFNLVTERFYPKPKCKLFGIDEHGRPYPIVNRTQTYFIGQAAVLKEENAYYAPTIAEVVMWLYEKHDIWIQPTICSDKTFKVGCIELNNYPLVEHIVRNKNEQLYFNSPTEAYEAAIEYTLNNLI